MAPALNGRQKVLKKNIQISFSVYSKCYNLRQFALVGLLLKEANEANGNQLRFLLILFYLNFKFKPRRKTP